MREAERSRERHGRGHHDGRHGGHREQKGYRLLVEDPGTHLLFIGSRSCTRHKGTMKMELQQEEKLSFLIMEEVDWITGAYLQKIEDAVRLLVKELHPGKLILFGGCQIEVLSMDYKMLTKELSEELQTTVCFHKGCHFVGYDPNATE